MSGGIAVPRHTSYALAASLLLVTAHSAQGQLVVQESFAYPAGVSLQGLAGGTGWAGSGASWSDPSSSTTTASGSLTYGGLETSGGSVTLSSFPLQFQSTTRNMASALPSTGEFWVSFLIQRTTAGPFQTDEYGGVTFGGDPFLPGDRVFLGAGPVGLLPNDNIQYTIGTSGNPRSDVAPAGGTPAVSTATVLVAARVRMNPTGAESIAVFVNPSQAALGNNASSPTTPNLTYDTEFTTTSNVFSLQYGNGGGYRIDELRIGGTWADVTPVPEPVSLLAATALGAGLLGLRRRFTR
jgi:hypothetical protein